MKIEDLITDNETNEANGVTVFNDLTIGQLVHLYHTGELGSSPRVTKDELRLVGIVSDGFIEDRSFWPSPVIVTALKAIARNHDPAEYDENEALLRTR